MAPEQQRESRYDLALTAGEASAANLWAGGSENQGHRRSPHVKPANVSFGFKAGVTIEA